VKVDFGVVFQKKSLQIIIKEYIPIMK